jgi:benzil reductase ((S)-benzoin forming)
MFIVTGGGSGIGQALALELAARGKSVLIVGRDVNKLQQTAQQSSLIEYLVADVATSSGRNKIVRYVKNYPTLDGLIHNAGIIEPIIEMRNISVAKWHKVMATNVDAALFLTQKLYSKLQNGRVLNIGSGAAYFPVAAWSAYCVSKAALSMLTRCWQIEASSMAVTSVKPGIIDTPMQDAIRDSMHMQKEKHDFFQKLKDNKQLITPATIASFLVWLLLDVVVEEYIAQEWDIYDTTHHMQWLKPPHVVPVWSE